MKSVSRQSSSNSIVQLFDGIAPVYDKLNHILSFGLDFYWRRKFAGLINSQKNLRILDIAAGTGDLLIAILRKNPDITEAVGLDISKNMLEICSNKILRLNLSERVNLICADVNNNELSDKSFDFVTMGFGIRNTADVFKTLLEVKRLLKEGGKALILEFSVPQNRASRFIYLCYLRYCVPFIGRIFSGDKNAYKYLSTSIEEFYSISDFSDLLQKAGFENISATQLTFGAVCIYSAEKPEGKS